MWIVGTRIIVVMVLRSCSSVCFLQAFKAGLYGPKIVWFFVRWFSQEFWRIKLDTENVGCTVAQMDQVAEGSFVNGFFYRNPIEERGIANMTGGCPWISFYASFFYSLRKRPP